MRLVYVQLIEDIVHISFKHTSASSRWNSHLLSGMLRDLDTMAIVAYTHMSIWILKMKFECLFKI